MTDRLVCDPVLLTPFRRPIVFRDCILELYCATNLTATRLKTLGMRWPATEGEVLTLLALTPSPMTRAALGHGVCSGPVTQMIQAAQASAGISAAPLDTAKLVRAVVSGDERGVPDAADALAMDLVTGHAGAAAYESVLAEFVSKKGSKKPAERLALLAAALLERAILPDVDGGAIVGGAEAAVGIFRCMAEATLLCAATDAQSMRGEAVPQRGEAPLVPCTNPKACLRFPPQPARSERSWMRSRPRCARPSRRPARSGRCSSTAARSSRPS